jgi:hypothetical protein
VSSPNESFMPFKLGEIFPASNQLAGISAKDVGPEIAIALDLKSMSMPTNVIAAAEAFIRRFAILPEAGYLPLATWVAATYVSEAFDVFPYIALLSPVKRCGKTRVLEVLELLCARAWRGTLPTSAALYRMMENSPTLLLDEVEALREKQISEISQNILAVLNAGHRKGATVPRCEPPSNKVHHFAVYGPKAFAAIGKLPDTLADRSICITMQRKSANQAVDRFLQGRAGADAEPLRESLTAWAELQTGTVRDTYEGMSDLGFLTDRDADLWMPLFAVCAVVVPARAGELKRCALMLTGMKAADDVEDSLPLKLLADLQVVLSDGAAKATTAALIEGLKEMPDSPWDEFDLNPRKLSRMLRPFGPEPRQVRIGSATAKGYLRTDLEQAFSRYLPALSSSRETSETPRANTHE